MKELSTKIAFYTAAAGTATGLLGIATISKFLGDTYTKRSLESNNYSYNQDDANTYNNIATNFITALITTGFLYGTKKAMNYFTR
jgi:hypothetical protein